ncbi:bestrophin family protein [Pseudomonas vancouverensis]|uniref:Bestrophin n=1 Tax=Pseudomonas vancouverensis TaxID=95300 RepID=A0A1H2N2R6_PSEVA|nr:bestrophin family protein [Pseudomonas vancouverensis]KAB0495759.1 bestrophin [Pseudomonas vancouverensis]TDB65561.1 bestrophin [Pseudomonas vancouverensis]SDU99365.1 putative membrane protein [Pseudomonas vancouverensis]
MIVRPKPNLISILTSLKGSIAKRIAWRALMVTLLASVIVLVEMWHPSYFSKVSATPFTLLGLSLSIFMSFRNNACYERWYEARKAWGDLLVEVRSMARETQFIQDEPARRRLLRSLCGFAHALNARLHRKDELAASTAWLDPVPGDIAGDLCGRILMQAGEQCSTLAESGVVNEWRYTLMANHLTRLTQVQAICERIKNTPLPFPYTLLLHRTIYLFCILLPFAMAEPLGWMTPVFTAIVSYTFFGLDAIADALEDPFGGDENQLPIDALVRILERDVLATLGDTPLPPLLEPVDFVLN